MSVINPIYLLSAPIKNITVLGFAKDAAWFVVVSKDCIKYTTDRSVK
jgi:hypothetical protein